MRLSVILWVVGLLAVGCGGQASQPGKGQAAAPALGGGKADISDTVRLQGELGLGEAAALEGRFSEELEFHGYTLDVRAGAQVQVEVTQRGSSRGLDTTLYLFGPQDEAGGYGGSPVAFNDDDGWGLLSRVKATLEQEGRYLVVVGTFNGGGRGNYRVQAECLGEACAPEPAQEDLGCVFGQTYYDLKWGSSAVVVLGERVLKQGDALTELEQAQIVEAVRRTAYEDVSGVEEAFAAVDQGVVYQSTLWDASNRRPFVVYEVGAGDNSFGAFFAHGTTDVVADIYDGDLYACSVPWGPERRLCQGRGDCAQGFYCVGGGESSPGRCVDLEADRAPAMDEPCGAEVACPVEQGLTCAGDAWGGQGMCLPAWQRGAFAVEAGLGIPDGQPEGVEVEIPVSGLATVSTDVRLDMSIYHGRPEQLRVTLINPVGTEAVVFDGPSGDRDPYLEARPVLGFPGDEDANGVWRLKVVDLESGAQGSVDRVRLDMMSRWD